jgi:hypothetical protein
MSTRLFAEFIEPLIQKKIDSAKFEQSLLYDGSEKSDELSGALGEIARYAAFLLGSSEEAMLRRLYAIRKLETRTLNLTLADVFLEALDSSVHMSDLPVLAGNTEGAREMVDAYHNARGTRATTFEERALANKLLHFCAGLVAGIECDLDDREGIIAELVNSRVLKKKIDQLREAEAA